jgi:hypothetical protein
MSIVSGRRGFLASTLAVVLGTRTAAAREVDGTSLPDEVRLTKDEPPLRLVGAGVFRFFFLRYYVCGLYLAAGVSGAEAAVRSDRPRRVGLVALRRISAFEFLWGLDRGLADNTVEAELKELATTLEALRGAIRDIGTLAPGARVGIDYLPGVGTQIVVDDRIRGGPIAGKALNDAVMKVWIGERPLDASLKQALLGDQP